VVRLAASLFGFLSVAAAQEAPLIVAHGRDLASFEIVVRLEGVARSSPRDLAQSFARLQREQHLVRRRFLQRFRVAHLGILRRYYAHGLVAAQEARYRQTAGSDDDARSTVSEVKADGDRATAQLEWAARDARTRKWAKRAVRLTLARRQGSWWILAIHDQVPGRGWVERKLGVPPDVAPAAVPTAIRPDRSAPRATVDSLQQEVRRLKALGDTGRRAMARKYFAILAAFYGEEVARRARAERPRPAAASTVAFQVRDPKAGEGDATRIDVLATEEIPGAEGKRSAVGQAAFDLREGAGGWRIVGEFWRPQPNRPLVPTTDNFGLFFHLG
jgi:hypothetical protein